MQEFQNRHNCFLKQQQKPPSHVLYIMLLPSIASAAIFSSFVAILGWGWGIVLEQYYHVPNIISSILIHPDDTVIATPAHVQRHCWPPKFDS